MDWLKTPISLENKTIWVAGHSGLVGQALCQKLSQTGCHILTAKHEELDLRDQTAAQNFVQQNKPDMVIMAAARVGGIGPNSTEPATFLYDNLMMASNVIHASYKAGVKKLLFLGSSCIYPRAAQNPITEEALLTGPFEPTNEAYALAKVAGLKLCETYRTQYDCDFISAMPCNLYGPGDHFDENRSHVIPALIMRAHKAKIEGSKTLEIWGSGTPRREFLYVDDLAEALIFMLQNYNSTAPLNIGAGTDITIRELAQHICRVVGFKGQLVFNTDKPDGTQQKLMDSSRIYKAGWQPSTGLKMGLERTYEWFLEHKA